MKDDKVFIIAEAGVNHNGSLESALKLVDIAQEAGADAVKFQTFIPGECTGKFAVKVDYLEDSFGEDTSRYEITQQLALPFEDFITIRNHAVEKGIMFITTPDGYDSLDYVIENLDVSIIKIGSTEVTNIKFLEAIAKTKKKLIFSTGMSTLGEIEIALNIMGKHNKDITVLHCVSEYPAPFEEVNLKAMLAIKEAFKVPVGLSDHTATEEASIAAVALGARVLEKHFTIDKDLPGPDHKASMSPAELKAYVQKVRNTELLLGDGIKQPTESEKRNIEGIRRSIVADRKLEKGTVLKEEYLACKRPGSGIHPYDFDKIIGMTINKDFEEDEPIMWENLW